MGWINKGSCFNCGSLDELDEDEIGHNTVNVCGNSECLRELRQQHRVERWETSTLAEPGLVADAVYELFVERNQLRSQLAAAQQEAATLRALLKDVASSGVAFEDSRLAYMDVQINRETWLELHALAGEGE